MYVVHFILVIASLYHDSTYWIRFKHILFSWKGLGAAYYVTMPSLRYWIKHKPNIQCRPMWFLFWYTSSSENNVTFHFHGKNVALVTVTIGLSWVECCLSKDVRDNECLLKRFSQLTDHPLKQNVQFSHWWLQIAILIFLLWLVPRVLRGQMWAHMHTLHFRADANASSKLITCLNASSLSQ